MKKIISLVMFFSLFCSVNIFAEGVLVNGQENSQKEKETEQYVEQMTAFVTTFMNGFKNLVDQDEKQEIVPSDKKLTGITLFSKKKEGETIETEQIRIFQVLKPNVALVKSGGFPNEILMLLVGDDDDLYYDNQKIDVSKNKVVKQVGIYQYTTKNGDFKTIPAVSIK